MNCIVHAVTKSQTRLSNFHFHRCVPMYTDGVPDTIGAEDGALNEISSSALSWLMICWGYQISKEETAVK